MRTTVKRVLWILLAFGIASRQGWSLQQQPSEPPSEPPDLAAYRLIYDPAAPAARRIELADAFLADTRPEFVASRYRENVYLILFQSSKQAKEWSKALKTADQVEIKMPTMSRERHVQFFVEAMAIADKELRNAEKTREYARKIVELDPTNAAANEVLNRTSTPGR